MSESALPATPYKGLIPYAEEDAPFFFGRDPDKEIIKANLIARRLTLLYGPSGVGKSSVLRAGVEHQLLKQARQNLAKRGKPELAVVVFNQWRDNPRVYLELEVLKSVARLFNGQPPDSGQMPSDFVEMLRINTGRVGGRLLIILDQFEEYFLYHAQEDGHGTFAAEFPRAVSDPELPISFLISIREDALAKLDRFEGRIPHLFDNYLRLEHLDPEAAREAIERPIDKYNQLHAAKDQPISIEPKLVDAVLDQVKTGHVVIGEAGRGVIGEEEDEAQIETPFLQLVMTRLWQEEMRLGSSVLRAETLRRLGGAEQIVKTHLDEVMSGLSAEEQTVAAKIFPYLVTRSRTKIAYPVFDLVGSESGIEERTLTAVLKKLSGEERIAGEQARILRPIAPTIDQPGEKRYEIFHDVLGPAILNWRAKYVEELKRAETERQLELEARERERAEHQLMREQKLVQRQRWLLALMALLLLAMIGATAYALTQRSNAITAQQKAAISEAQALAAAKNAVNALSRELVQKEEAVKQRRAADQAKDEAERERTAAEQAKAEAVARRNDAEKATAEAINEKNRADNERRQAEQQARKARVASSNLLAVQAKDLIETNPQRSLLLTIEALKIRQQDDPRVPAAEEVLREALAQTGGSVVGWHDGALDELAISPNGHWLVGAGRHSAYIFDLTASKGTDSSQKLEIKRNRVGSPFAISADSHWLVTGTGDPGDSQGVTTVHLWDLSAREPAATGITLPGGEGRIADLLISKDSHWLMIRSRDNNVRLWNLKSDDLNKAEPIELGQQGEYLIDVMFSPDNRWFITHSSGNNGLDGKAYLWDLTAADPTANPFDLGRAVNSAITNVAFSSNGRWLATGSSGCHPPNTRIDSTVRLWDLKAADPAARPRLLQGHTGPVSQVTFSPDSRWLVTNGEKASSGVCQFEGNNTRVWDVTAADPLVPRVLDNNGRTSRISLDSRWVLLSLSNDPDSYSIWDLHATDQLAKPVRPNQVRNDAFGFVDSVRVGLQNQTASFASSKWEWGPLTRTLRGHEGRIRAYAISADKRWAFTTSEDGSVRRWDLTALNSSADPIAMNNRDDSFFLSPDHHWLATRGPENTVLLWDMTIPNLSSASPKVLRGHTGQVSNIAFSQNNRWLVTGSADRTARLWNLTGDDPSANPTVLPGHKGNVSDVAISRDNHWLVTAGFDGVARVWDLTASPPTIKHVLPGNESLPGEDKSLESITISPDSRWLITSGSTAALNRLWDLSATNPAVKFYELGSIKSVLVSPDSRWIVVVNRNEVVRLWNLLDDIPPAKASVLANATGPIEISLDSHWLATSGSDNTVSLWDLTTANPIAARSKVLRGHFGTIKTIAFSPESRWLATNSSDRTTRLWNLTLPNPSVGVKVLGDREENIKPLAFSPDNHWLLTGASDVVKGGPIRLWDLTAAEPSAASVPLANSSRISRVAFSRDGVGVHWLIVGSWDNFGKKVMLWNMRLNELVNTACYVAGRNLTEQEWKKYFPGEDYRDSCPGLNDQR